LILHSDVIGLYLSGNDSASNPFGMTQVYISLCIFIYSPFSGHINMTLPSCLATCSGSAPEHPRSWSRVCTRPVINITRWSYHQFSITNLDLLLYECMWVGSYARTHTQIYESGE